MHASLFLFLMFGKFPATYAFNPGLTYDKAKHIPYTKAQNNDNLCVLTQVDAEGCILYKETENLYMKRVGSQ